MSSLSVNELSHFFDWLIDFSSEERSVVVAPPLEALAGGNMPFLSNLYSSWKQGSQFSITLKERVRAIFNKNSICGRVLIKEVATSGDWGNYSEITAFYYLLSRGLCIEPFVNMDINNSFRSSEGLIEKDGLLNSSLGDFVSYFEIKSLSDRNKLLLSSIKNAASRELKQSGLSLVVDGAGDMDHLTLKENFSNILYEVKSKALVGTPCILRVPSVHYTFRLIKKAPLVISETSFSPYRYAKETQGFFLKTWKQIHKEKPNISIYVDMPWMGSVSDFMNSRQVYYRAVARRVFVGLKYSSSLLQNFIDDYVKEDIKAEEVSRRLSSIIILYDQPYNKDNEIESNVFLNPNAAENCKLSDYSLEKITDFNMNIFSNIEDFKDDNY